MLWNLDVMTPIGLHRHRGADNPELLQLNQLRYSLCCYLRHNIMKPHLLEGKVLTPHPSPQTFSTP